MYNFDASDDGLLGAFELPHGGGTSNGFFNHRGSGWDETDPSGGLEQGGYAFVTMIHELGHGLGQEHPHEGTGPNFPSVSEPFGDYGEFDLNQRIYTRMSYNDGWQTAPHGVSPSDDFGYQGTPMAVDVATLQEIYGANTSYRAGDDAYTLPTANASGTFYECLWDAGGTDTIRAGATERDAIIDLNHATLLAGPGGGGFVSYVGGIHGGFTIANGAVMENAVGARGDDRLTGNEVGNVLNGGGGADRLTGNAGADRLLGGDGADRLDGGGVDVLIGGLGADLLAGAVQRDAFVYGAVTESNAAGGLDRITDFAVGSDEIDLRRIDWSAAAGDQDFTFVSGALTAAGQVHARRDAASGDTFVEAEVDGVAGADLRVRLDGLHTLSAAEILL